MKTKEEQLLNDYGNLDFEFEELYKYRASYINRETTLFMFYLRRGIKKALQKSIVIKL